MFAVILPVVVRALLSGVGIDQPTQYYAAIGGAVSLVFGYIAYRRLHIFPGIASGGYIFVAFSIAFGILSVAFVLFRLDYSRIQLLASYILSILFFVIVHLRFVATGVIRLGVVPGGRLVNALPSVGRVNWVHLADPDEFVSDIDGIVADLGADHSKAWSAKIANFAIEGVPVYHVKQALEQLTGRVEIEHLAENTLGSLNPNDVFLKVKDAVDRTLALLLLILLAPFGLIIAIAIAVDTPGNPLFMQLRTGFRTKTFTVFKFRTMHAPGHFTATQDDDTARLTAMTRANDDRITPVGKFLRRTRIDELPQLINVLRGQMSLIGPRPEALALTRWYEKEIPFYHYRHIIKPGITGWAQVRQGHVAEINDVREKLNLDFYYVKNFSFWLDILIIIRTIQTMFTGRGAR